MSLSLRLGLVIAVVVMITAASIVLLRNQRAQCTGSSIRVITYNVGNVGEPRANPDRVADVLEPWRPDVVLLQEANRNMVLAGNRLGLRHSFGRAGNLILSRFPIRETELMSLTHVYPEVRPVLRVVLSTPFGTLEMLNAHFPSIEKTRDSRGYVDMPFVETVQVGWRELFGSTPRSELARALIDAVPAAPPAELGLILGGDLNTVPWSRTLGTLRSKFRDSFSFLPGLTATTYRKLESVLPSRVDYLLYRGELRACDTEIIRADAADHFPVYTRFGVAD